MLWQSRDLCLIQVSALIQSARKQNQIAHCHSLAEWELPALAHRAVDRDVTCRAEFGNRENSDLVVFPQRNIVNDRSGGITEACPKLRMRLIGISARDEHLAEINVGLHTSR